jgi:hypothetical protein
LDETKCFALNGDECVLLNDRRCYGCAFYKTVEELGKSQAAAFARIAKLPFEDQHYIAQKYYGGNLPWRAVAS